MKRTTFLMTIGLGAALIAFAQDDEKAGSNGALIAGPGKVKTDAFNDQAAGKNNPVAGDWLRYCMVSEPKSLNPITSSDSSETRINSYVMETLINQDKETFEYIPGLAERWDTEDLVILDQPEDADDYLRNKLFGKVTVKGDQVEIVPISKENPLTEKKVVPMDQVKCIERGAVFTFYIREGVKWHDGEPFTAHDVTFSYDIIKNKYTSCDHLKTYYIKLVYCKAMNDLTLRMIYAEQYFKALDFTGGMSIVPRHIFEKKGATEQEQGIYFNNHEAGNSPIGTGPYKFKVWDRHQFLDLEHNEQYWKGPKGYVDRIRFRFISNTDTALAALKSGEVDFLPSMRALHFHKNTENEAFKKRFVKAIYYTGGFNYIGWNLGPWRKTTPFLRDRDVRTALAMLCPRQEMLDKILYGEGVVVSGSQYYFGPAYDHAIVPLPFDPEAADEMLIEAGWYDRDGDGIRDKDGVPFEFTLIRPSGSPPLVATRYQEELNKAGIKMELKEVEWAAFIDLIEKKDFDACSLGWASPHESDPYQIWHSDNAGRESRGSNMISFDNAEVDKLIEQGRVTLDAEKRYKIWHRIHAILHEEQPYLFLYCTPNRGAYDKRYRGVKFYRLRPGYDLTEWFVPTELRKFKDQ